MEDERKRILEMLQQGQVTVEQAAQLLEALEQSHQTEPRPGAPGPQRAAGPTPPAGMDWSQFGRSLAQQIQQQISTAFGGMRRGGEAAGGGGKSRENYSAATLDADLLSRLDDGTAYTNYGHLVIADDVPEDLLDRKIGNITNFGRVQGPANLLALLQTKCGTNFGVFGQHGHAPDFGHPHVTRPPRRPRSARRASRAGPMAEAVLMSETLDPAPEELSIRCYAGNLELAGTEEDAFRLLARKPLHDGEAAPDGWETQFKWSADREAARHTFTLGDPDNPNATNDLTFRFEIPFHARFTAHTDGGYISAHSLGGDLNLRTGGGDIAVAEFEGPVTAATAGGDISAADVEGSMTCETAGGDISVADIEGNVTAKTAGGDVSAHDVEGELTLETGGGDVSATDIEGPVTANVGGGDISLSDIEGPVRAETGGGNIALSDIEGPVTARTGGGNASLSDVDGDVTADTAGGNLAINQVAGSVTARSSGGNVAVSDVEGDATIHTDGGSVALSNIAGTVTTSGP